MVTRLSIRNSPRKLLIDREDRYLFEGVSLYLNSAGYVVCHRNGLQFPPHRLFIKCPKGREVDHVNRNKLDNRKSNLRVCTRRQNCRNVGVGRSSTSGYKGVHFHKRFNLWSAHITKDYKQFHLGYFKNKESAALAYNKAALKKHGKFACLNILTRR